MDAVRRDAPPRTRDVVEMTVTVDLADPAYQAYLLLRNAFTIALILAGTDKFLSAMVDWHQYLAPAIPRALGVPPEVFLWGVGIVEIALGIWLAFAPRHASYWVAGWFGSIVINSLMLGTHYDVALRDIALLVGALALGRLASGVHRWHEQHA